MSLDDTIANALAGFPPGTVLSFDSLRDAARAAQLGQRQLHGQIVSAIAKGLIEPMRVEVDGVEYDLCRPTEHIEGNHRLIRHYRRTGKPLPGQPTPTPDAQQIDGQLALVEVPA
jgi:hypothetical protein